MNYQQINIASANEIFLNSFYGQLNANSTSQQLIANLFKTIFPGKPNGSPSNDMVPCETKTSTWRSPHLLKSQNSNNQAPVRTKAAANVHIKSGIDWSLAIISSRIFFKIFLLSKESKRFDYAKLVEECTKADTDTRPSFNSKFERPHNKQHNTTVIHHKLENSFSR